MGVAYFIALDKEDPGFETFVNGKAIARASDEIRSITEKLGVKSIDELTSFGDLVDEFDLTDDIPEMETAWFDPQYGIDWVKAVTQYVASNRSTLKEPDGVIEELDEYRQIFQKAKAIGAKWHFELDL